MENEKRTKQHQRQRRKKAERKKKKFDVMESCLHALRLDLISVAKGKQAWTSFELDSLLFLYSVAV